METTETASTIEPTAETTPTNERLSRAEAINRRLRGNLQGVEPGSDTAMGVIYNHTYDLDVREMIQNADTIRDGVAIAEAALNRIRESAGRDLTTAEIAAYVSGVAERRVTPAVRRPAVESFREPLTADDLSRAFRVFLLDAFDAVSCGRKPVETDLDQYEPASVFETYVGEDDAEMSVIVVPSSTWDDWKRKILVG